LNSGRTKHSFSSSGKAFAPSEVALASGIYRALHAPASDCAGEQLVLIKGDKFPSCPGCGSRVRFELEHSAPSLAEDQDFQSSN